MENLRYPPKRVAEILGISVRQLADACGKRDA
jgi:hypothetical protein